MSDVVKICADRREHGPHEWPGFPPDQWRCPGRYPLTEADVALLGEAFGGSSPSSLLTIRVERIVAAHVAEQIDRLLDRVRRLHSGTHWCLDADEQSDVFEPGTEFWPCPTLAALSMLGEADRG